MSWARMPFVLLLISLLLINVPKDGPDIVITHMPELGAAAQDRRRSLFDPLGHL